MLTVKEARGAEQEGLRRTRWLVIGLLSSVSVVYFADIYLRASEKYFWYDELFTVYFARLDNLDALWVALTSGIDFNPPLFYLLTRAGNSVFGEGTVVTRLPEILGFWVFSLSLFWFVKRSAGMLAGLSAMIFPMVTAAYYYAYEARPHGVVLGFCGLALVCWQKAAETFPARRRWLAGLSMALLGAFLMHCFALTLLAPFTAVELYRTRLHRRIDRWFWVAMTAPTLIAGVMYVALLRSYRKLSDGTDFSEIAAPGWQQVLYFYQFLLEPCLVVMLAALVLFAVASFFRQSGRGAMATQEVLLGLAFLTVPLFGVVLAKMVHGPFFDRYFISAVAGISLLLGLSLGGRVANQGLVAAMAILMSSAMLVNFGRVVQKRMHGQGAWLIEPSSKRLLDTTPGKPLDLHPLLVSAKETLPTVVLDSIDFIYLMHYAPDLKERLYYAAPSTFDFAYGGFDRFLDCCGASFHRPTTFAEFAKTHADYLVYGETSDAEQLALLGEAGARIESLKAVKTHFLAHLSK